MEEKKLATEIINRIREYPRWMPNHETIVFPKGTIGYYDTKDRDEYFELKYDNIEFTNKPGGYDIDYRGGRRQSTFDLMNWLRRVSAIVLPFKKPCVEEIIVNGVKYVPEK